MFPDDRRSLMLRLSVMQYVIASVFALLAVAFWVFQVAHHAKFAEMAENNHLRKVPLPAPRGVLFDRHGEILVENHNTYNIALVREQTRDLERTLALLADATGVSEAQLWDTVNRRRREPSYRPIVLIANASFEQVVAYKARQLELPGIIHFEVPTRKYPTETLAAHLFGYVGEVTETQLARPDFSGLEPGAIVGQAGVEQAYNRFLMGKDGDRFVVVNSLGREIREVGKQAPVEGRRLQLTIDADVQRAVEEAFRHFGYNGAGVLLDARSGEVLSLVSLPAYDPNRFAVGIDRATWLSLTRDRLLPLQNRALQGRYSPGSTFKIPVAIAALEEGVVKPDFKVNCSGGGTFYGRYFQCWRKGGHGTVDLKRAMEQSCNVYFYTIGNMLGVDRIHKWATALGLGVRTGIDLPNEVQGIMPSTEWKRQRTGERWYAGETISVAIGQGQVSVTPLSQAVMMMSAANGGTRYTPHLLKAVDEGDGWRPVAPPEPQSIMRMKPETVATVNDSLWRVVNAAGTGGRSRIAGRDVSGKTGTAQVISLQGARAAAGRTDRDLRHHGWFVFFAPRDNPEVAGVIFAEHAQSGANAAPIARHALETYFAKKDGLPLPTLGPAGAPPPTQPAALATGSQAPVPGRPGG